MKLIVWLGNPGREHENTRHNVGFFFVDMFRERVWFSSWVDSRFSGVTSEWILWWEKIILLKPTTYMNLSGQSVSQIVNFYKIDPKSDILVIVDDLDMEFAKVRYREKWSAGGQNGIKSIITSLWTDEFSRIKVGIGRDSKYAVSDWVLSRFQKEEIHVLQNDIFPIVQERLEDWITR